MKKMSRTIEIKAPVQRVYDFLTQPANLPGIWPNLVSVSNVVAAMNGSHDFDWNYKMGGIHFKGHAKTEAAEPGKLVRVRNEGGIDSTFLWTYQGLNGANTRLKVDIEYTIPTPVIGKLAEALAAKMNERDLDHLLANLKDVMEQGEKSVAVEARPH
jgi:uncharacterized membrane protein